MPYQHTNRYGKTYILQSGVTPSGKPRYYFGLKLTGEPLETAPAGYEIWEKPESGQVYCRKPKPSPILSTERDFLEQATREATGRQDPLVEIDGPSLVVYLLDRDPAAVSAIMGRILGRSAGENRDDWCLGFARYEPQFSFKLVDEHKRLFSLERMCYRGGREGWANVLGGWGTLPDLAKKYLHHLGQESYFEL